MSDSGADIVIAQHTHNISVREYYGNSYLNYWQGDFLFATSVSKYKETGLLLEIEFEKDRFYIKEHLLKHEGNRVFYDKAQDLSEYDARNERLKNGELFTEEYNAYSREYVLSKYEERHILRMISAIRFEEFNDIVDKGLHVMLMEGNEGEIIGR